jgi:DEAD/DEAH box helicase domain-containing protein
VVGYREIKWDTHENVGIGEVQLPPYEFPTTGYWLGLSDTLVDHLRELGQWSSDPNDYGPQWQKIRDQVRARDHYRCQICGALEIDRPHHVHHKIPFRRFNDIDQANKLDNLITLCPICHRRAETSVHIQSGLAGLSYAIYHLAPVHLLCDLHDIEVTSDPQSALTNGLPTVIVYDAIPAGIGLSRQLFEIQNDLLSDCYDLISQCECTDGCPSCVGPVAENGMGAKKETLAILSQLLGYPTY